MVVVVLDVVVVNVVDVVVVDLVAVDAVLDVIDVKLAVEVVDVDEEETLASSAIASAASLSNVVSWCMIGDSVVPM